jgi:hypothetical protein
MGCFMGRNQWQGRGGAYAGAGRKSKWQHSSEGTKTVRLPKVFVDALITIAVHIDGTSDPIQQTSHVMSWLSLPETLQRELIELGKNIEKDKADSRLLVQEIRDYILERQGF